ncbi:hypothetical protein EDC04DRAFT_2633096 [Pisolithus marmoratus]|nr:hypothetical protein EDC04DRAFT_2633096 [Pisolithus marmoratus]
MSHVSHRTACGIAEHIRQIFYISAANFVFPLIFNVALIISSMTDRSQTSGTLLISINYHVTVLGVLCATLWFSGLEWARTRNEPLLDHTVFNSPNSFFGRDSPSTLDTGTEPEQVTIPKKENKDVLV